MYFDDLKNKFIHTSTKIIFGKCVFHKDLIDRSRGQIQNEDIIGGGEFIIDTEKKTILLHLNSHDFGKFDADVVKQIIENLPNEDNSYRVGLPDEIIEEFTFLYE